MNNSVPFSREDDEKDDSNLRLKEGDTVSDRYKIVCEIATTELSAIYVAEDTRLSRKVALKHVFKKGVKDDFKSLIREAHLLSTMTHPNVLTVFDCTADDKGTYIISEYLRGDTLETFVEKNTMTLDLFVSLAEQMLMGLAEAHKQGIVHGDLKPNNVMILQQPNGKKQVKLLDFGLSRVVSDGDSSGPVQAMEGSAYFMSPEEFDGQPKCVSSDIYSLGCVCYYAITGRYPFDGDNTMQIMASHMQHKLHEPTVFRSDLPAVMNQWLLWMVNFRPETRPTDASEALSVLTNCYKEIQHSEAKQTFLEEQVKELIDTKQVSMKATAAYPVKSLGADKARSDWPTLRNMALRSFAKLVNKQQAANFMVQILAKHNLAKNEVVPRELRRLVITDYYALIPNRSKREALMREIEKYL